MKKIFKYTLAAIAGTFLLAGCETANEQTIYSEDSGVSFRAPIWVAAPSATDTSFELPLNRAIADGALTVDITTGSDFTAVAEIFTVPSSVSFAAGEYTATITIGMNSSLMELGKSYSFTVRSSNPSAGSNAEIPKTGENENAWDPPKYTNLATTEVRCAIPLVWELWARGTYTGWYDEEPFPKTISKAMGADLFRIDSPYVNGNNYQFKWDITSKAVTIVPAADFMHTLSGVAFPTIFTGIVDSNGPVYWSTDVDPEYTFYNPETKTLTINSFYGVFTNYDSASYIGGYGWGDDFFVITEFLQGNPWE